MLWQTHLSTSKYLSCEFYHIIENSAKANVLIYNLDTCQEPDLYIFEVFL